MAREYCLAAKTLIAADRRAVLGSASLPTLLLLSHGIELMLKAYLLSQGISEKQLKNIGHDLVECLAEADGRGLRLLGKKDRAVVRWLNEYYNKKEFEYVVTQGLKSFPHVRTVEDILARLLEGLRKPCLDATINERGKIGPRRP
jgi:hypothetical protein